MKRAMTRIKTETAAPPDPKNNCVVPICISAPKVASIVPSRVNMDTQDDAREIAFDAEKAGLLYFLYLITLKIAIVSEVKV